MNQETLVNEEKETQNKISVEQEKKREQAILRANQNYEKIYEMSKNVQNKKYQYLPFWKEKESRYLLREIEKPRKFFKEYKRGTIVRVDFGVNIGCEFSQIHYAIVLNKKDNRLSETISVIPLTSKDKGSNLNIGNVIFDSAMYVLNEQMHDLFDLDGIMIEEFSVNAKRMQDILDYYTLYPISSFACYRNIITISKSRILNPINEFDFINKAICDSSIMEKIDKEIVKYYTDTKI